MRNYFYPGPGSNFHMHSWESWNKLGSSLFKKSSTPKHHSKSTLKSKFSSRQVQTTGQSNPSITLKKASNYVKYNRKKSNSHLEDFHQSDIGKLMQTTRNKPMHLFQSLENAIQLQGTRILSLPQRSSRIRPLSSKTFPRARTQQRSYTVVKQRVDDLETPTPW